MFKQRIGLLLAVFFLSVSAALANLTVVNNSAACTYQVRVFFAPLGTCLTTPNNILLTVPPGGTASVPCPAGQTAVGVVFRESFPVPGPRTVLGDPFCGLPTGINGFGSCGVPVQFFVGGATNFLVFG